MNNELFPRTMVGGVSLSRMIIGTNWMFGFSHTSVAADNHIKTLNKSKEAIADILEPFLLAGVDTIMGLFHLNPEVLKGIHLAEERTSKKIIIIDTPFIDVSDTKEGRKEAYNRIKLAKEYGATICLPHHVCVEKLVCKGTQTIDRLSDYLYMIREQEMIPGLSAHMPELIVYSDLNNYDVETYVQIYNCMGFLMQVEIEYINKVIWSAKKPVMTIKSMAAGRTTPFVGLNFSWATLREQDMVTVGCMTREEAIEDIEISMAALQHRQPNIEGRNSPVKTKIMK